MAGKHPPLALASDLRRLLGAERVADDPARLAAHAADRWFASSMPQVVVHAASTADVSATLEYASRHGVRASAMWAAECLCGEHGVGIAKQRWWPQAVPEVGRAVYEALKRALDPQGLLNPDKFVTVSGAH